MSNQISKVDQAEGVRSLKQSSTKVIAVAAGKGGVGKTTVSVNLALALSCLNKKVMLFDGDLGLANVDVMLGLHARYNLSDVIDNVCQLSDIILDGPFGLKVIPSSSGVEKMVQLNLKGYSGIINEFNTVTEPLDYLIVDTAAGLSDDVCSFTKSAQEVVIVVCDEPTSLTDAYALIKVLNRTHRVVKFHIVTNMIREPGHGRAIYSKLYRVAQQYLDVTLNYLGSISNDELIYKSIKQQQGIITAYPNAVGTREFQRIAKEVLAWPQSTKHVNGQCFFLEKLLASNSNAI